MKKTLLSVIVAASIALTGQAYAEIYADFPITVKNYAGSKTHSEAYTGQIARHTLHNSAKKLVSKGASLEQTKAYFNSKEAGRVIIDPVSKDGFPLLQTHVDKISKGKNLSGKVYKG